MAGLIILVCNTGETIAQNHVQHQSPPFVEADEPVSFDFRITGINSTDIQEAYLYYRYRGENSYRQQRASILDSRIIAEITFDENRSTMAEYYLLIEFIDGNTYTWPEHNAEADPATVEIVTRVDQNKKSFDSISGEIEHTILAPEPGESVRANDFFMAVTLFYEFEMAETDSFLIQLNGRDITGNVEINPYLITYVPQEKLSHGNYQLDILYNSPDEKLIEIASWEFRITSTVAAAEATATVSTAASRSLISSGQYQATARSQSFSDQTTSLFRNNFRISGNQGNVRYSINAMLTTQENPRLQPQNRYSAHIQSGNWFLLEAGHVFPVLHSYLIAGRRMYGVHSSLKLFSENLQMQFLYGELNRSISPLYREINREERVFGQNSQGDDILLTSYLLQSQPGGTGSYARNITGARLGFGNGEPFGMSISAIRVEDAINSINVIRLYEDMNPDLMMSLDPTHLNELENNPDLLDIRANAPAPQGNFAFATDLMISLDNNRFQFRSDFAASLVNNDISDGILDRERSDYMGFDLDDNIESLLDQLSWLIVINENMNALPIKFEDDKTRVFVPKGIFATQSRMNLNYLNHNVSIQYQWVGPDYSSLANVGQRRDIAGFSVMDRFRVFSNTLYLTLGHENLQDNVIGNRDATMRSVTNRVDLGWYPRTFRLPRIRLGVRRRTRDNGFIRTNPFLPESLMNASVRSVEQIGNELVIHPSPRSNVTMQYTASVTKAFLLFDLNHDASFNFTHMATDDIVFKYGDFTSNNFSIELISSFSAMPVRTNMGLNLNKTESSSGLNKLDIFGFNTGASWYFWRDRFQLTSDLAMTFDRSESVPLVDRLYDDFSGSSSEEIYWLYYVPDPEAVDEVSTVSYIFGGALRYRIHNQHNMHFRINYTRLSDRHKLLNIPNNHLAQIRYVYDF